MKKNQLTTVDQLHLGDRFYFANDNNRVVWEMVNHGVRPPFTRSTNYFCLLGSHADHIKDKAIRDNMTKSIKGNTKVVYLRSMVVYLESSKGAV
ncbi:hypothetical protein [Sphingobacterium multivorum]|uniref:hypothetical protein n=1 Tax=Sphingobacterium multivorum TaxID=28454 RepID=UPI0028AB2C43|nr:hypothetical protein [Sphingobacterium multivorum]